MTAEEILTRIVEAGGRVIADPERPRLFVPHALKGLAEKHREILRELVLHVARLVEMPLDRFEQEGSLLEVRVPWLEVTLWFVPVPADVEVLARQGVSRGRVWTAAELRDILTIQGLTATRVITITKAKLEFAGEVVEVRPRAGEPAGGAG